MQPHARPFGSKSVVTLIIYHCHCHLNYSTNPLQERSPQLLTTHRKTALYNFYQELLGDISDNTPRNPTLHQKCQASAIFGYQQLCTTSTAKLGGRRKQIHLLFGCCYDSTPLCHGLRDHFLFSENQRPRIKLPRSWNKVCEIALTLPQSPPNFMQHQHSGS